MFWERTNFRRMSLSERNSPKDNHSLVHVIPCRLLLLLQMGKVKRKVEEETHKPIKRSATKKIKAKADDQETMPIIQRLQSVAHIKYSELPFILQIGYPCMNWTENCTTGIPHRVFNKFKVTQSE